MKVNSFISFSVTADDINEEFWRENNIDVSAILNDEEDGDDVTVEIYEYVNRFFLFRVTIVIAYIEKTWSC